MMTVKTPPVVCDATTIEEAMAQVVATLTGWSDMAERNAFTRPTEPGKMAAAGQAVAYHDAAAYFASWTFPNAAT